MIGTEASDERQPNVIDRSLFQCLVVVVVVVVVGHCCDGVANRRVVVGDKRTNDATFGVVALTRRESRQHTKNVVCTRRQQSHRVALHQKP